MIILLNFLVKLDANNILVCYYQDFYVMFQFAFNFWWNSIVKTFVMMIGEFEYDGIFNDAKNPDNVDLYTSQVLSSCIELFGEKKQYYVCTL